MTSQGLEARSSLNSEKKTMHGKSEVLQNAKSLHLRNSVACVFQSVNVFDAKETETMSEGFENITVII